MQLAREAVALEIVGEGDALLADGMQFFAAQGDNLVSSSWGSAAGVWCSVILFCLIKTGSCNRLTVEGLRGFYAVFLFERRGRLENTAVRPVSL